MLLKVDALVIMGKIPDAIEFTTKLQGEYIDNPEFLLSRGKIMIYNNNIDMGKKYIREALNKDPDNKKYQVAWKNLSKMDKLKKEATEKFQAGAFDDAITLFGDCLAIDPSNFNYNSAILFNRAVAHTK